MVRSTPPSQQIWPGVSFRQRWEVSALVLTHETTVLWWIRFLEYASAGGKEARYFWATGEPPCTRVGAVSSTIIRNCAQMISRKCVVVVAVCYMEVNTRQPSEHVGIWLLVDGKYSCLGRHQFGLSVFAAQIARCIVPKKATLSATLRRAPRPTSPCAPAVGTAASSPRGTDAPSRASPSLSRGRRCPHHRHAAAAGVPIRLASWLPGLGGGTGGAEYMTAGWLAGWEGK